jgi:RNA polymerase sigma factor
VPSGRIVTLSTQARREEINLFLNDLTALGLTLKEVADASPKQAETRKICRRACRYLRVNPDLLQKAAGGRVPMKELSELLEIHPKTLERHRKYLVACAVALNKEYHCIMEYILSREGEE